MKEFSKLLFEEVISAEEHMYSNLSFARVQNYEIVEVRKVKRGLIRETVRKFKLGWILM